MQSVVIVTSIPSVAPTHASLSANLYTHTGQNAVEFAVQATAGTGTACLLRWQPSPEKWIPWGVDATSGTLALDTAVRDGWAHGVVDVERSGGGYFLILVGGGPTVDEAWIGGREMAPR